MLRQVLFDSECAAAARIRADDTDHFGVGCALIALIMYCRAILLAPIRPPPRHDILRVDSGFWVLDRSLVTTGYGPPWFLPSTLNPVYWYITKSGAGSRSTTSSGFHQRFVLIVEELDAAVWNATIPHIEIVTLLLADRITEAVEVEHELDVVDLLDLS